MSEKPNKNLESAYNPEGEPTQEQLQTILGLLQELTIHGEIDKVGPETARMVSYKLPGDMRLILASSTYETPSPEEEPVFGHISLSREIKGSLISRNWLIKGSNIPGYYTITFNVYTEADKESHFETKAKLVAAGMSKDDIIAEFVRKYNSEADVDQAQAEELVNFLRKLKSQE